jgi:hypothetical protein
MFLKSPPSPPQSGIDYFSEAFEVVEHRLLKVGTPEFRGRAVFRLDRVAMFDLIDKVSPAFTIRFARRLA